MAMMPPLTDFGGEWVDEWLVPSPNEPYSYPLHLDETETFAINNRILALLLGGAHHESARGTVDSTYYTHCSSPPTVETNWDLVSPGSGDMNKYVLRSRIFPKTNLVFVADATGYTNLDVSLADISLTNITGTISDPLNVQYYVPITASNAPAVGAGGVPSLLRQASTPALPPPPPPRRERPDYDDRDQGGVVGSTALGALLVWL
ncbi:hypothetical protein H4582DRAFT_2102701 [Lactarius indigo]|nr:hypothetical protein H4582DRAFT_2102701 [Lactarius indigo]